jgi:hypothetical protein
MKVRELRELLAAFDQDAEVRVEVVIAPDELSREIVLDIMDIDTDIDDDVILEVG